MAKLCFPETRVLWEHSAAWIALLTLEAAKNLLVAKKVKELLSKVPEHPGVLGYLPFVLLLQGASVPVT
jgi:hypothetical protein